MQAGMDRAARLRRQYQPPGHWPGAGSAAGFAPNPGNSTRSRRTCPPRWQRWPGPLACIIHAFHGMSLDGKDLPIIGEGPMAAIGAVYARQRAARVSIAVKDGTRASRVSDFADHVVTVEDLPVTHYDVVPEAVGGINSAPILTAISAVALLGQVVAFGVYRPDLAVIPVRTLPEK